jgi:hypothetical protein
VGNGLAIKSDTRGVRAKAEIDPLFTMRSDRQPLATHGNGFGLFPQLPRRTNLPPIATGCIHGAP